MKVRSLAFGLLLVMTLGCSRGHSDSTPTPALPPAKPLRITGVARMNFPRGDSALVLNYETDIPIEDMNALRKEVETIWKTFRNDVEKAQLNAGVIRAVHYETTGLLRQGKGYGFVFHRNADGTWRLQTDEKK